MAAAVRARDRVGVSHGSRIFLPGPVVERRAIRTALVIAGDAAKSIGRVFAFPRNSACSFVPMRIFASTAPRVLRANSEHAVLNANYLRVRLHDTFTVRSSG